MPDDMQPAIGNIDDLRIRQQTAWQSGQRLLVETLVGDSSLQLAESDWLELIYAEVILRGELGEACQSNEYVQRFPQFQAAIERLFALHQALETPDPSQLGQPTWDWEQVRRVAHDASHAVAQLNRGSSPAAEVPVSRHATTTDPKRFRVLRPHAQGGIGEVFLAFDEELHREVALKEIQSRHVQDASFRDRFVREAEVTGGLEHPGIVPVYSLGHHGDGRPFYAMRFIRGDSLLQAINRFHADADNDKASAAAPPAALVQPVAVDASTVIGQDTSHGQPAADQAGKHADGQKCPSYNRHISRDKFQSVEFRKLLGRFIDVCQAMEYAHSKGVLHRDLKPANIMLGNYGETLIVDWGLAKAVGKDERFANIDEATYVPSSGSSIEQTADGSMIGTPAYMSPEQAAGRIQELSPATDIYSLGATLYHILTGRLRFPSLSRPELLRRIQAGEFPHPREINASIPKPLDAICLKALALQPTDRYESAAAIAEDIEHWLADEPVNACRETIVVQASRWVRKHRAWALSGTAALALVAIVSTVAAFWINGQKLVIAQQERDATTLSNRNAALAAEKTQIAVQEKSAREKADLNAETANKQTRLAKRNLYIAHMNLAQIAWNSGDLLEAVRLLERHRPQPGHEGGPDDLRRFEWYYWDRLCHSDLLTIEDKYPTSVIFSPDGARIASVDNNHKIKIRDSVTGNELLSTKPGDFDSRSSGFFIDVGRLLAYSPDGARLASVGTDAKIRIWNSTTGQELNVMNGHLDQISVVAWSPDGQRLATRSYDATLKIWDVSSNQTLVTLNVGNNDCHSLAFSPDGQRIASGDANHTVTIWNVSDGKELHSIKTRRESLCSLAFSPDGERLAMCDGYHTEIWNVVTDRQLHSFQDGLFSLVAFSPDGLLLITGTSDNDQRSIHKITIRDAFTGEKCYTLYGHSSGINDVSFSAAGERVATASVGDGTIKIWDLSSVPDQKAAFRTHGSGLNFSPVENRLGISGNGVLESLNIKTDKEVDFIGHADTRLRYLIPRESRPAFSPDGLQLACIGLSTGITIWDTRTWQILRTLNVPSTACCVAYSMSGQRLASGDEKGAVTLWNSATGQRIWRVISHFGDVESISFDPTGKQLASGSRKGAVLIWNAASGAQVLTLRGGSSMVTCIEYSPDGQLIASAYGDGTVRMWSATSGQEIRVFKADSYGISSLAFTRDGERLAIGSGRTAVKLWDVATGQVVATWLESGEVNSVAFSSDGKYFASLAAVDIGKIASNIIVRNASPRPTRPQLPLNLAEWHRQQAVESEQKARWFAARFHLQRLITLTSTCGKCEQSILHSRLVRAIQHLGETGASQHALRRSIEIDEKYLDQYPDDPNAAWSLASSCQDLGEVLDNQGKSGEALTYYLRHQQFWVTRGIESPNNMAIQRTLANSYRTVGGIMLRLGQAEGALEQFYDYREVTQKWVTMFGSEYEDERSFQHSHTRIGEALLLLGRVLECAAFFEKGIELSEVLIEEYPNRTQPQIDLFGTLRRMGDVRIRQKDIAIGIEQYQRALVVGRKLIESTPNSDQVHLDLIAIHIAIANVEIGRTRFAAARKTLDDGLAILDAYNAKNKRATLGPDTFGLKRLMALCDNAHRLTEDLEFALAQEPVVPQSLVTRVKALLFYAGSQSKDVPVALREKWNNGDLSAQLFREAMLTSTKLRALEPSTFSELYDAGCCFSLCLTALEKLDVSDKIRLRTDLQAKALDALKAAIAAGWEDANHIIMDSDLDSLRDLPEFKEMVEQLRGKPKSP